MNKAIKILSVVLVLTALFAAVSCKKQNDGNNNNITQITLPNINNKTESVTETANQNGAKSTEGAVTVNSTANNAVTVKITDVPTEQTATTAAAKQEHTTQIVVVTDKNGNTVTYVRTGEAVFSDDADNKYIAAVSEKYGVDAARLAAVYTIPDADGNIVMEFDGSRDNNGKLIRNGDTLIAIYSVDKDMNSKRASDDTKLSEYSFVESKTMFFTTKKYIIPKFEAELNQ